MVASRYLGWLSGTLGSKTGGGALQSPRAVMGYATGYGAGALEPFVRSLRHWFDGEIILAVDNRPDVRELLASLDVTMVIPAASTGWSPHPVVERFAAYDAWIGGRPWLKQVLLTDVRDVVFQADPFAPPADRLEVFIERTGDTLARHAFNRKHLKAVFGETLSDQILDRPCICVGTVFGPAQEAARLCRLILMLAAIPRSGVGGAFGADQAACNLAVHLGLIEADIRPNHDRVATIGEGDGDALVWGEDGLVRNPDGSLSPVLHQYDRYPHLADGVQARWGSPDHSVFKARRKTLGEQVRKHSASVERRLPELR
ncbi:hypothetical protein [Brevundimonas kwangchunensis]|uniref:hypothetical protein n=1 Tax=Brevundimonas kwangchunensis TaxID=322163 RepID=UPI0031D6DF77